MSHPTTNTVVPSICPFCGVGCGMGIQVCDGKVVGVEPQLNHPVSQGKLCTKGWSTPYAVDPIDRITTPLIREGDSFRPASWDEACNTIVEAINAAQQEQGPDAVGVIACARATNEDCYAAQKFARAALHTNNIDHCARICHSPSVAGLRQTLGSGAMTNSISDIALADLLVIFGCDPTSNHTIIGGQIIAAKLAGAKLLVVDPRSTRLAQMADLHLQLRLGTNIALINGLLNIIFDNGWEAREFLDSRCENEAALRRKVEDYPPERVAEITGVPVDKLIAAAKMYSQAQRAMLTYGMGITQYISGTNNVIAISNLALVAGQIGRPGTGINPLRGQNNVQGACDMGALPNVFPGYQDVTDSALRQHFERAWKCALPAQKGLTSLGMTQATLDDSFRCMIIMGEDPVVTDPDQNHVQRALQALDMLVVIELVMTETAKLADVVLPAAAFSEKSGTFTNCERRVKHITAAISPPGEARSDWMILGELATRLGYNGMQWQSAEAVFDEMASLNPLYASMSYAKLIEKSGLQWPCDAAHPDGTPLLHSERFSRGKGRLIAVDHSEIDELPDEAYPLFLTTTRLHFHYGCGSMTRKSPLLERETPVGVLFIHPHDADRLNIRAQDPVRISSRRGTVETRAMLSDELPPGTVAMPYHFKEAPSNQLTNNAQDPVTKMPELKACAVRVEKIEVQEAMPG
ncbi:MAG: formate dehydrogenase subunit alpha [Gammaproteobacteria bacterium]|nr:formate dehydrogenase subunit alpha [Gammaproteobacteria bacterium]